MSAPNAVSAAENFSRAGLRIPGHLWRVDRFVELRRLQRKYADSWRATNRNSTQPSHGTIRRATTHLLYEIISALVSYGEREIADAVLNSTSDYHWHCTPGREMRGGGLWDFVESVDEFPSGLTIENRKDMFLLDQGPDGRYYQCWIIDRVMEKGGFWVGRLVEDDSVKRYFRGTTVDPISLGIPDRHQAISDLVSLYLPKPPGADYSNSHDPSSEQDRPDSVSEQVQSNSDSVVTTDPGDFPVG
jgi:hypothetical protein